MSTLGNKLIGFGLGLLVIAVVVWLFQGWNADRATNVVEATAATAASTTRRPERYTKLRVDRMTPLCDSLNYQAEIDTQGDEVNMAVQTSRGDTTLMYNGHGELQFPVGMTLYKGLVCITSSRSTKQARVRVWEVVYR